MNTPPQLTFIDGPECYALAGWEDRKRWAMNHDPLWRMIFLKAESMGIQESDTLKLLAVAQAEHIAELQTRLIDNRLLHCPPVYHDPRIPLKDFKITVDAPAPVFKPRIQKGPPDWRAFLYPRLEYGSGRKII